jgi:hypothetical protein
VGCTVLVAGTFEVWAKSENGAVTSSPMVKKHLPCAGMIFSEQNRR